MPSLISGYEYDIFISYRHKDNKSDGASAGSGQGWVTEFVRTLRSELEATFKEDISIYFDENPHDGLLQHHEVDDSLREKLRCLVFIPIVSQTYCDPKAFAWQHELLAFIKLASEDKLGLKTKVGGGNTASRVLPVRIHEVDAQDKKLFEEATGGIMRPIDFIYKESGVNRPLRPSDNRDRNQVQTDYRNQVNKVANAMKDIIAGLKGMEVNPSLPANPERKESKRSPQGVQQRKRNFEFPTIRWSIGYKIPFIVATLAFVAVTILYFSRPAPEQQTYRTTILPPAKTNYNMAFGANMALSPDGRLLAFVASDSAGNSLLWVRPLNALSDQALKGTDGAIAPFWSPDSRFIGFFANGKLRKIEASGGPSRVICDAAYGRGGTWNENGVIVFSPETNSPLYSVAAVGGLPTAVTGLDTNRSQLSHRWPCFLPDGKHFLYSGRTSSGTIVGTDAIFLASLDSSFTPRLIANSGFNVGYANGHLLFLREQTLMAEPFDPNSLQTTGEAFPVAEQVHSNSFSSKASFSASQSGNLVYHNETGFANTDLLWYDRAGKKSRASGQPALYQDLRLSSDEKWIATSKVDMQNKVEDIWLLEIAREVWTRFTFDSSSDRWPVWSPDGTTIVFASERSGSSRAFNLFQRAASGAGSEEVLLVSDQQKNPTDWSLDGKFLAYTSTDLKSGVDIWILPMSTSGDRKPFPFLQTDFNESRATFSPDGRWIAYTSDESGRSEVYIRPFPGPGGKWQVSTNGGTRPRWRGDGKELFFLRFDLMMMVAEIELGSSAVKAGSTKVLFQTSAFVGGGRDGYDVTGDGKHFLVSSQGGDAVTRMTLVVNWPGEIKK